MTNLPTKKLSFKETFSGFHIYVEFTAKPRNNKPQSNYDYDVEFVSANTCYENVDIHLLAGAIERINTQMSVKITENVHGLYQKELALDQYKHNILHSPREDYEDLRLQQMDRDEQRINEHAESNY